MVASSLGKSGLAMANLCDSHRVSHLLLFFSIVVNNADVGCAGINAFHVKIWAKKLMIHINSHEVSESDDWHLRRRACL